MASHGAWGPLALIGIQILQVVISIIPGEVVEIGAGYAFGAVPGALLCLAGAAAGSAMIFWLTKKFGIRLVEAFISREQINSLGFIKNAHKLNLLVFILYFIPGTPKDILTYFIGLTPMKLTTFLLLTTIARIPSVISSTIGGHALGSREYLMAVIVFVVTGIVSAIGILVYRRIEKRKAPEIQDK